jgi:tetratricopeptide (TPR) repeat protein
MFPSGDRAVLSFHAGLRPACQSAVKRSARICPQILAAKQEQAGFARRKRTVSSVNCCAYHAQYNFAATPRDHWREMNMQDNLITYEKRHLLPDPDAVCIFNHHLKSGGTTMANLLRNIYKSSVELWNCALLDYRIRYISCSFYSGHYVQGIEKYINSPKIYMLTMLREPLSRAISHANYLSNFLYPFAVKNKYSVDWCLYNFPSNLFVRSMGNGDIGLAEANLFERHVFFGIMEYYQASITALSQLVPAVATQPLIARNVTPYSDKSPTQQAIDYFCDKNRDDIELYAKALREFKRRVPRHGGRVALPPRESIRENLSINKPPDRLKEYEKYRSICENNENIEQDGLPELLGDSLFHSTAQDCRILLNWLEQRLEQYGTNIYWAFCCVRKLMLTEKMAMFAETLFARCCSIDPYDYLRVVVECRLDVARTMARLTTWRRNAEFASALEAWLKKLSNDPVWRGRALHALGMLRMAEGKREDAIPLLQEAVELAPDNLDMHAALWDALLQDGEKGLTRARHDAEAALAKDAGTEWALRQMMYVLQAQGDVPGAVSFAGRAVEKNPYFSKGWRILAHAHVDENPEYALECIRKAVEQMPDDADAGYFLCELLRTLNREDEALAVADALLGDYPYRGRLHRIAAEILEDLGKPEAALERMRKAVEADPDAVDLRLALAHMLARHGRLEEMEATARESSRLSPGLGWPHAWLGMSMTS